MNLGSSCIIWLSLLVLHDIGPQASSQTKGRQEAAPAADVKRNHQLSPIVDGPIQVQPSATPSQNKNGSPTPSRTNPTQNNSRPPSQPADKNPAVNNATPARPVTQPRQDNPSPAATVKPKFGAQKQRVIFVESARAHDESNNVSKAIELYEKALLFSENQEEFDASLVELRNTYGKWRVFGWELKSIVSGLGIILLLGIPVYLGAWLFSSTWKCWKNHQGVLLVDVLKKKAPKNEYHVFVEQFDFARYQLERQARIIESIEDSMGHSSFPDFVLADVSGAMNLIDEFGDAWWIKLTKTLIRFLSLPPTNFRIEVSIIPFGEEFSLALGLRQEAKEIKKWSTKCGKAVLHENLSQLAFAVASHIKNESSSRK